MLKKIVKAENGAKYEMNHWNTKYVNGKRTDDRVIEATTIIGKDKNGMCYIGVKADNKAAVKFELKVDEWFQVMKDGEDISSKSELSVIFTRAEGAGG